MDLLDEKLLRAWELFAHTENADDEIAELLPSLVEAGYVEESGHSPTGLFWNFTDSGVRRAKEHEDSN